MPHSNDQGHILLQAIERDVTTGAKADGPFLKIWVHVFDGSTDTGVIYNDLHPITDCSCCKSGCIRVLLSQKLLESDSKLSEHY